MLEVRGRAGGALGRNEVALAGNCWGNVYFCGKMGRFGSGNVPGNAFVISDKISSACRKDFSPKKGVLVAPGAPDKGIGNRFCCRWFSGLFLVLSQ